VGEAWLTLTALRERVWRTVVRLAAGESPGPEISIDKLLLSGAEQAVYDASRLLRGNGLELGDDDSSAAFRQEWFFSRLVSVYGGAAEVQRDIVAQRILSLPRSR
jgi:alkylation response protein AidB-like acyl-CoA dehydrogenase